MPNTSFPSHQFTNLGVRWEKQRLLTYWTSSRITFVPHINRSTTTSRNFSISVTVYRGGGIDRSKERWNGLAPMPPNVPRILEATFADDTEATTKFELYQQHRLGFARECGKGVKAWTHVK